MTQTTLKTRYKFIHFGQALGPEFEAGWVCYNNRDGDVLGLILWYRLWRQWIFTTGNEDAVFSTDCLADIQHFMGQLAEARKGA